MNFSREQLHEQYGDRVCVAPVGARPKASAQFFRVVHGGMAPGLSHGVRLPGHVRRPQVEDFRAAWRTESGDVLALILGTQDARRAFSHAPEGWGLLACSTGPGEDGQEESQHFVDLGVTKVAR